MVNSMDWGLPGVLSRSLVAHLLSDPVRFPRFPALHRMEEAGWLTSYKGESENRRRAKFYRRTKAGERQLGIETNQWTTISSAIGHALKAPQEELIECGQRPDPRSEICCASNRSNLIWTPKSAATLMPQPRRRSPAVCLTTKLVAARWPKAVEWSR